MKKFIKFEGVVAPLDRPNIDTDSIIPKQFLKSIKKTGFGDNLFDAWRFLDEGSPEKDIRERKINKSFVLNKDCYKNSEILLARDNFGCGSSREHAPWALLDYGFKVILAPSFGDIFYNNSLKNGLLPIRLLTKQINFLFEEVINNPGYKVKVDLEDQTINLSCGIEYSFDIDQARKSFLLNGFDEIDLTLNDITLIKNFEVKHKELYPWLFS